MSVKTELNLEELKKIISDLNKADEYGTGIGSYQLSLVCRRAAAILEDVVLPLAKSNEVKIPNSKYLPDEPYDEEVMDEALKEIGD